MGLADRVQARQKLAGVAFDATNYQQQQPQQQYGARGAPNVPATPYQTDQYRAGGAVSPGYAPSYAAPRQTQIAAPPRNWPQEPADVARYRVYPGDARYGAYAQQSTQVIDRVLNARHLDLSHTVRDAAIEHCKSVNFDLLAQALRIRLEDALNLSSLALHDTHFLLDDSGSMCGGRWEQLKDTMKMVSTVIALFDRDGYDVSFLNAAKSRRHIKDEAEIDTLFGGFTPDGCTPLGEKLQQKVLNPFLQEAKGARGNNFKPLNAIAITDGEPTYDSVGLPQAVKNGYVQLRKSGLAGQEFGVQIALIGSDAAAATFVNSCDDGIAGTKVRVGFHTEKMPDLVDGTSSFELEAQEAREKYGIQLPYGEWLVKLMVGAIDPQFDAKG